MSALVRNNYFKPEASQSQSPFFQLPGELRNSIYRLALNNYDDPSKIFSHNTYFSRPGYRAECIIDTALLQTCQRVYSEAWFLPWLLKQHTMFLAWRGRKPMQYTRKRDLRHMLEKTYQQYGSKTAQIPSIRIFAQLTFLESGEELQEILDIRYLQPRCVVISIRHTDWWAWEHDRPLRIGSGFVDTCRFPDSVEEVHMELETLRRKIPQLREVVQIMKSSWAFRRMDETILTASEGDEEDIVVEWEGSSIFEGPDNTTQAARWLRDETNNAKLSYYVQTVRFKKRPTIHFAKDHVSPKIDMRMHGYTPTRTYQNGMVPTGEISSRNVALDAPAQEIFDALERFRELCWCQENHDVADDGFGGCCLSGKATGLGDGWRDNRFAAADRMEKCKYCLTMGCASRSPQEEGFGGLFD